MADTRPSAIHDVPFHTPPSQWEDVHDVNVDVQVTAPSLFLFRSGLSNDSFSHSSFVHLVFNCMALTSFGVCHLCAPLI